MNFEIVIFYLFSTILILAAIGVVTVRNPVYAALFLIVVFFNSAALWLLLEAEFLGITLVLVYVGAVMVLFLFVIMMLDVNSAQLKEGFTNYLPFGLSVLLLIVVEMALVFQRDVFDIMPVVNANTHITNLSNTEQIGIKLYTVFLYPLEIAAVILLVAIIAAIMLTLRERTANKGQDIEKQVRVKRQDRIRLVNIKSEKR